jgi:hypothetical protein
MLEHEKLCCKRHLDLTNRLALLEQEVKRLKQDEPKEDSAWEVVTNGTQPEKHY